MSIKIKVFSITFGLALIGAFAPAIAADEFDPGMLASDASFGNYQAFANPEGIQRFLEIRRSALADTSIEFLRKLKEPADIDLKNRLEDPNPALGRLRTAAELVYDAANLSKINPQVILATLQKEQSLIDTQFSGSLLQRRLDRAMGFACPDNGGCSDLFLGFYFQLFGNVDKEGERYLGAARSLSKNFYTEVGGVRVGRGPMVDAAGNTFGSGPKVRTSRAGDTITMDNTQGPPYNAPATSQVTLKNAATAALYRYTPHVYNGNYNFWKFFRQWFKFANGSLIKLAGADQPVYFIDNGQRRHVSGAVMSLRKLDVTAAFVVSQQEMGEFVEAKPLPPPEGALVAPASGVARYLVADSKLRPISDYIAGLRKLDLTKTLYLPDPEVAGYEAGERALPPEGTLIRATTHPVVYIVQGSSLRPISGFVFKQRSFAFANVKMAPDEEIGPMPKSAPLPPLDGTLAKGVESPLVYYTALGQKYPIPAFVFKLRKFKFSSVVTLGTDEIASLALAQHFAPADGTLLKATANPTVYLVEAGSLHYISGFMFKHGKYKAKDITELKPEELALLPQNDPLMLADNTLIKVKAEPTVYILEEGSKRALTYAAFTARKFRFADVMEVPQDEADRYPTGSVISE